MEKENDIRSNNATSCSKIFTNVDKLVSKPVLGSDGAAKWQEWKNSTTCATTRKNHISTAPEMSIKRNDRLGTGMSSLEEERNYENNIRKEGGFKMIGEGYCNFKRKKVDEIEENLNGLKRIRPNDVPYYLVSEKFEGWKKDYIFTTRTPRGIGYYWDGMDTWKEKVSGKCKKSTSKKKIKSTEENVVSKEEKQEKMKNEEEFFSKKEHNTALENNQPTSKWCKTKDTLTGKIYYYNRLTRKTTWTCPDELKVLPKGWRSATDPKSGKTYFYNIETNQTKWELG